MRLVMWCRARSAPGACAGPTGNETWCLSPHFAHRSTDAWLFSPESQPATLNVSHPMANPGDFAYTVKQQADIVRVIGDYMKLKKAGAQNYTGLCPFHGEKTPSFSVHATRQFYHCFGCGVSGDVFSFVQKI